MGWAPVITSLSFFCVSFFAGKWKGKSAARGMGHGQVLSCLVTRPMAQLAQARQAARNSTRAWLRHCLLRGESPRALRMKWNRCRPTLSCGLRPAVPAALRLACDRPFYSTSGAQCVIRPSASRLSASCAQLRIHTVCLLSLASTVCVRPARRPSGHCHARPSARVSSTGLETQGPEASLLLLQRNLVLRAAPLRSSPWALSARWLFFFCRQTKIFLC